MRRRAMTSTPLPLGLVLAGGLARRMGGGDKTRIRIGGKSILERVLARFKPQCAAVILNANGDPARFSDTGLPLACARSGDWRHPVIGLWPVALREDLRKALVEEDMHKIETWTARHGIVVGDWPATPIDPFFNVNTPADVAEAERIAAQQCDL